MKPNADELPPASESSSCLSASEASTYQTIAPSCQADGAEPRPSPQQSPPLARFLSDFTLGFSDGLTVPFALTAGLSSLGRTQTVIYAGLAELCAGSISMGIGGYLSALDEVRACDQASRKHSAEYRRRDVEEGRSLLGRDGNPGDEHKHDASSEDVVRQYLGPLDLPPLLVREIISSIRSRQQAMDNTAAMLQSSNHDQPGAVLRPQIWPVVSGLSISLGYVVGGLIPLIPYFIAPTVGEGLCWSTGLCLVALFTFGFGKCWLLSEERSHWRQSSWEGLRMLILGSLAAVASVLCIKLVENGAGGPT